MKRLVLVTLAAASACFILSSCSTTRQTTQIGSINLDQSHSALECWREIANLLPPGVELTAFSCQQPEGVKLVGVGVNVSDVYDFKKQVEASKLFVCATLSGLRHDEQQKKEVFDLTVTLPRDKPNGMPRGTPPAIFAVDVDKVGDWHMIIERLAAQNGLVLTSRQWGAEKSMGNALQQLIDIKWEGTDESLVRFLVALQIECPTLTVRKLLIQKGEKGVLRGQLSLGCLYRRQTASGKSRGTNNAPTVVGGPMGPTPENKGGGERYLIIITRKTFGSPPPLPPPPPAPPVVPPQVSFATDIRLTGLMETEHGVMAAFVRLQDHRSLMLHVGDVEEGFELMSADMKEEKALLKRGNEEVWFALDPQRLPLPLSPINAPKRLPLPRGPTRAALEKHLHDYQMELIRARGAKGPPIPMPLTPEMDDQLVKEGVLPPQ